MKKFFVFVIVFLTTFGVFADSNTTWRHSTDLGVYHTTSDIAILTDDSNEFPEEEVFVTFLTVDYDKYITFFIPDSINLSEIGGITCVVYAEDINTPIDKFDIYYAEQKEEGTIFSLDADDSDYIYYDMLGNPQKTFFAFNEKNMSKILVFNVNCSRLYKYSCYLY